MSEQLWAFVPFMLVMTSTPGPGNLTMLAIGQSTGWRSSLPFLMGGAVGFTALNSAVACGLGGLVAASPGAALAMRCIGAVYICWLALKVLRMHASEPGPARRFTFAEGVLLHPLSPKSWAMSTAGFALLVDPAHPLFPQAAAFVLLFLAGMLTFHSLWCVGGAGLLRLLRPGAARLAVNALLALLMVGSTVAALFV